LLRSLHQRLSNSLKLQLCVFAIVALVFFVGMALWGRLSDCGPHDGDGQCGISTFFGAVFGAVGGIVIFVGGGIRVGYVYEQRRRGALRAQRNHLSG